MDLNLSKKENKVLFCLWNYLTLLSLYSTPNLKFNCISIK